MEAGGGVESCRYLVLPTTGPPAGQRAGPPAAEEAEPASGATLGNPSAPAPTLAFGIKALRNCLMLCGAQLGAAQLASLSASEHASLVAARCHDRMSIFRRAAAAAALLPMLCCRCSAASF